MEEAARHLPGILDLLTTLALESTAQLLPEQEGVDLDAILGDQHARLSQLCAQIQLNEDKFNPRWNKSYGKGRSNTFWSGGLKDGQSRGGVPYFCPSGWVRFALKVCDDAEFGERFKEWGYLYHGTNGKYVGSILASGLRGSTGLCFCGSDESAVYMSPSIEYCGHPRYGRIQYNPETRRYVQVVLQCRVRPGAYREVPGFLCVRACVCARGATTE